MLTVKRWKWNVFVAALSTAALLLIIFGQARADSSAAEGTGKLTAQAHVDFKIIIPLVVGVNDGKVTINSKRIQLQRTCVNNVCTVSSP